MDAVLFLGLAVAFLVPAVRLARQPRVVTVLRVVAGVLGIGGVVLAVTVGLAVTDEEQDSPDALYVGLALVCLLLALALLVSAWKGKPGSRSDG